MIEITQPESRTLKAYLDCGSVAKTVKTTKKTKDTVLRHLANLVKLGILRKDGRLHYYPTEAPYKVKLQEETPKPPKVKKERKKVRTPEKAAYLQSLIPPHVTEEQIQYIRGHYGKIPRSKMAVRTGLSKVELNNTIMGLDLMDERVDVYAESHKSRSA